MVNMSGLLMVPPPLSPRGTPFCYSPIREGGIASCQFLRPALVKTRNKNDTEGQGHAGIACHIYDMVRDRGIC